MSLSMRGLDISFVVLGLVLFSGQKAHSQTGAKRALVQKQIKLSVVDAVQVRTKLLPVAFDDKGAPRKLTTEEVKELRGTDSKLPGYAADYSDLTYYPAVLDRPPGETSKSGNSVDSSPPVLTRNRIRCA
jgi:hypothetical protein